MNEFGGWCVVHGPRTDGDMWVGRCLDVVATQPDGETAPCELPCTGPGADAALAALKELDELRQEMREEDAAHEDYSEKVRTQIIALQSELSRIRTAMRAHPDSDLVSLAEMLAGYGDEIERIREVLTHTLVDVRQALKSSSIGHHGRNWFFSIERRIMRSMPDGRPADSGLLVDEFGGHEGEI